MTREQHLKQARRHLRSADQRIDDPDGAAQTGIPGMHYALTLVAAHAALATAHFAAANAPEEVAPTHPRLG